MFYRSADVRNGRGKRRALTVMALLMLNTVSATAAEPQSTETKLICIGLNNQSYVCESGHCCGESQCCSYYYELWWFWLVWTVIIILSCCCVCHHRRTKHRLQQQQRQHEINLIAYREVHNYSSLPFYFRFLPSYLLPAYEEVVNRPSTPPPPYSASQPGQGSESVSHEQPGELCPSPQSNSTGAPESNSAGHNGEETCHPPVHCPAGDAHKSYLDFEDSGQQQQVASATLLEISKQDKEPSKSVDQGLDTCPESKEKNPGRHRRFTGDSGIEVCVCSRGPGEGDEEDEMNELDGLMDSKQDFCDSCNPHSSALQGLGDEEQGFAVPERNPDYRDPALQRPPMCLHLHTINEQEAPPNGSNADPQS